MNHDVRIRSSELPDGYRQFFKRQKRLCTQYGVRMYVSPGKYVVDEADGSKCGGWFSGWSRPELAYAAGNKQALAILIHESCHMDQWIENDKFFSSGGTRRYDSKTYEEMTHGQLVGHLNRYRDCEEDCERRSVRKIRAQGLDEFINIEDYIKGANSYIWSYNVMKETGCWFRNGRSPYNVPQIRRVMPGFFLDDYTETPREVYNLILEHCF